ncbi:hypothetical protein NPIL_44181 [Nephila pilipes]|uniref:Uncharacterized protein n=1 Tax=Nephila pilipes TaxID=299642 RepID=A0A8X6IND9_NEPPI|nr:hypothetical protein NPIL_44181 [Nephila pilipes]
MRRCLTCFLFIYRRFKFDVLPRVYSIFQHNIKEEGTLKLSNRVQEKKKHLIPFFDCTFFPTYQEEDESSAPSPFHFRSGWSFLGLLCSCLTRDKRDSDFMKKFKEKFKNILEKFKPGKKS